MRIGSFRLGLIALFTLVLVSTVVVSAVRVQAQAAAASPGSPGTQKPVSSDAATPAEPGNAAVSKAPAAAVPNPLAEPPESPAEGLVGSYYSGATNFTPPDAKPFLVRIEPGVNFTGSDGEFHGTKLGNNFAARFAGAIRIPEAGEYAFELASDDGSQLAIDGLPLIDNGGLHSVEAKSATVNLQPGVYPILVEFFQAGGGAECVLKWKPPGGDGFVVVPPASLLHADGLPSIPEWDKAAWTAARFDNRMYQIEHGPRYARMDYGPSLAATYDLGDGDFALKGQAIRMNPEARTNVLFDTELLRYARGWTDGMLRFDGVAFSGAHGPNPSPSGRMLFTSRDGPGFYHEGAIKDPRPKPFGPLPREWGRYKGLYRHGEKTVLSYRIGTTDILDLPEAVESFDGVVFLRTLVLQPSDQPVTIVLCDASPSLHVTLGNDKASPLETPDGRVVATFPARKETQVYRAEITTIEPDNLPVLPPIRTLEQMKALTAGGPQMWSPPIVTAGQLGEGDGPYVVDTLTIPFENPWNSWMRLSGVDFLSDGTAAVCTWSGDVWLVSGIDQTLQELTWRRIGTGLFQPLGLRVVKDQIYVLGRDQITRLQDLNGDGETDFYECFNNDCQVTSSFHEFSLDLQVDSQGNFYFAKGGPVQPGGRGWMILSDHNGTVMKVTPDGKTLSVFSTGVRAPNGMGMGPDDQITVADNEGTWTPACRINFLSEGLFVGVPDLAKRAVPPTDYDPPICWLPHRDVDNSSGGQVWVPDDRWGPFAGQMLHLSYGTCSLFKVYKEQVDGVWQGGVVRFPLQFDSGIMRAQFSPVDGQLYVSGLRGWQTSAAKDAALQRVRYTGKPVRMPAEVAAYENGLKITFTAEIDPETADDTDSYLVERWNYRWTSDYGSAEWSVNDPDRRGREELTVASARVLPDKRSVFLAIPDLKPCMQMSTRLQVDSADGVEMDYTLSHTIHHLAPAFAAGEDSADDADDTALPAETKPAASSN